MFGLSMEQLYMYILIFFGALAVLHIFFGDVAETRGAGAMPFLNPAILLAFFTVLSAGGYLLERATGFGSPAILLIALVSAFLLNLLLYFFVLLPLSSVESSTAYADESLAGEIAQVITPIPVDGFGEVLIETHRGAISKRATGFDNEVIDQGQSVLIIEVVDGTLHVRDYIRQE